MVHRILRHTFESHGCRLEVSSDPAAGLAAIHAAPPDIVVVDLKRTSMENAQVCREIKSTVPRLPVIVLSSLPVARGSELLQLAADEYVMKPFSPKDLLARARALTERNLSALTRWEGTARPPVVR